MNRYEDLSHGDVNEARLCHMAAWCQKRGISLVLVATPLWRSYRAAQNPAQTADMHRRIAAVVARFPQTVRFLDFSADPSFTANDFFDSDHLNTLGAVKLSRKVKGKI